MEKASLSKLSRTTLKTINHLRIRMSSQLAQTEHGQDLEVSGTGQASGRLGRTSRTTGRRECRRCHLRADLFLDVL